MPIRPQIPAQPNPKPNNKAVHQFETVNMPAYSLTPVPYNDIRLRSGNVVEPLIIEDVPSPVHEEGVNPQHLSNMTPSLKMLNILLMCQLKHRIIYLAIHSLPS